MILAALGTLLLGYAVGAVPSGVIVARIWCGADVLRAGSRHTGGTNVARVVGSVWAGVATTVIDLGLGALAAHLGQRLCGAPWGASSSGVGAIIGHDWSLYVGLRGGVGLSSLFGMLLVQAPLATVAVASAFVLLWLVLKRLLRHDARGTIIALLAVPLMLWVLGQPRSVILSGSLGVLVVMAKSSTDWRRTYRPNEGVLSQLRLPSEGRPEPDGLPRFRA